MGFSVTVPAGCGEFLQGRVGNRSVIISTPVNAYVKAIVDDGIYDEKLLGEKSRQAVQRADSICGGRPFDKVLEIQSDIPKGKGMASSSADIGACALAVARHKGYVFSDETLCRLAVSIEPTDPVFCRGVVAMDRYSGQLLRRFPAPRLVYYTFDCGGMINTQDFYSTGTVEDE
ncbi:MAG: GHMP kinase, partial [Anaeroglobus sp.]|nr:GHMP kinase [Anaeroglobus sp.]